MYLYFLFCESKFCEFRTEMRVLQFQLVINKSASVLFVKVIDTSSGLGKATINQNKTN